MTESRRKIAVITTSRADYSHLYWPLRALASHPRVDLRLLVLGAHLSPEFGRTIREIEMDGFPIEARIECLLSSDTDVGMAKAIGVATLGLADYLSVLRPDILLLIADRYEMLAPASAALALRVPIAHIEGGEISEGAIDDAVRNAITKMAHVHFTSTWAARDRVIAMGEEPWRVHRAGAPSLDYLRKSALLSRRQLERKLAIRMDMPTAVVAYHPVTLAVDTLQETAAIFAALEKLDEQLLFCYPNADAGSRALIERTRAFVTSRGKGQVFVNLDAVTYWSLLRQAAYFLGNSSSGIMETPSLALPAVNIGMRQQGRERARNILDAAAEPSAILAAVAVARSEAFRKSLRGMTNPYGDGRASETIAEVLTSVPLGPKLLLKRAYSVSSEPTAFRGRTRPKERINIPLSAPEIGEEEISAVSAVLRSGRLSLGPRLDAFESAVAHYTGAEHAVGVSSGTAGLHLAVRALGLKEGDEVILPSFTFIAAAHVLRYERITPVFADIDPVTLNLAPESVEAAVTPQTRAILAVHTFGVPAAMDKLLAIARRRNLFLIEDACEALGAEWRGRKVGTLGDVGIFAFYPNKQITTAEGGMIVTQNARLAARVHSLRNQGRSAPGAWSEPSEVGYNYRLSELHCALGLAQMARIESILARREEVARDYHRRLAQVAEIELPPLNLPRQRISWFAYVIRLKEGFTAPQRDRIIRQMQARGVACGRYFAPIHLSPIYRAEKRQPLPITESVSERVIALPFFNRITPAQIEKVSCSLHELVNGALRPESMVGRRGTVLD